MCRWALWDILCAKGASHTQQQEWSELKKGFPVSVARLGLGDVLLEVFLPEHVGVYTRTAGPSQC